MRDMLLLLRDFDVAEVQEVLRTLNRRQRTVLALASRHLMGVIKEVQDELGDFDPDDMFPEWDAAAELADDARRGK